MYTREQAKEIVDKVLNMATADAVEVNLTGGERSGTRWANSSITTNLVQYDRQLTVTVRLGQKSGTAETRDFSDAGLKTMVDEALSEARQARDNPNLPELLGPQEYIPVDAALPDLVNFGPGERARMVQGLHRHRRTERCARRRLHPEDRPGHRATRIRRACSRTIASPKPDSSSRVAWPTAAAPAGPARRGSRISG